ncbi:hypothetical protein [Oricola sp.]|uniref:hypothetical protein n=1 Tax=Oricola sp. TaxID=1979950 RepID=UPI003BA88DBB
MKSLIYTIYRNGSAGFSNLAMSLELGVVLAGLTNRVLVLKGNNTPLGNVVQYHGLVRNTYPSKVTDLIEPGVPWIDAERVNLSAFAPHEISDKMAQDSVFYFPPHLSTETDDFRSFLAGRKHVFTIGEAHEHAAALSFSGGPDANTLGFYSSFFYLDEPSQRRAFDIISNMKPRAPYAEFARRVADDLGRFNAVHIRRGDFKQTFGVTTLDRSPAEVIEALDHHFSRSGRLVVLTDEADDPFFDEIRAAYGDVVFIDHHMLAHYDCEFQDLPAHDSIALAYLSQLVAARSDDFIGTMTSTFTALIQRMRGNLGKEERFKFLWNELPAPGDKVERGSHPPSECIPLDKGVMVEQHSGPYSWNRFNDRLNPAWMREWPESFLDEAAMVKRTRDREYAIANASPAETIPGGSYAVSFQNNAVVASSNVAEVADAIARLFALMGASSDALPIGDVRLERSGDETGLLVDRTQIKTSSDGFRLLRHLYREVVRRFIERNTDLVWLHAGCVAWRDRAVILPGAWGRGKSTLVLELYQSGWDFLSDDIVPVDPRTGRAIPFPGTPQVRASNGKALSRNQISGLSKSVAEIDPARVAPEPRPVSAIVFPHFSPEAETQLVAMSPAQAVGELLENCLSFQNNTDATVEALCALVENLPAYRLLFSDAAEAGDTIVRLQASLQEEGAAETTLADAQNLNRRS